MAQATNAETVILRQFSGLRAAAHASPDMLDISPESHSALRQFSAERLMAYGVHHADMIELRARVASGEGWEAVATALAGDVLDPAAPDGAPPSGATQVNRLLRASALLRASQVMMLTDTPERSAIFTRASALFQDAATLAGDRVAMTFDTVGGVLEGWLYPSRTGTTVGRVVVIGGVEGWAMDFGGMGEALAARGLETLLLDGPGQGQTRLRYGHYLSATWAQAYSGVFDALDRRGPAPLAFVGNSMGGSVAMHLAAHDPRIVACCSNGGTSAPHLARVNTAFFAKMIAHVGKVSEDEAIDVWKTIDPVDPDRPVRCPLLIVHGGMDPMITEADSTNMLRRAASIDKQMVVFSDGDHCVYNHADDKHAVIGDWLVSRLRRAG